MRFPRFLLVAFLIASTARAEGPLVDTFPPGDDQISVVKKGEAAPYTGQLYSPDTALRWAFWLQQYKLRLKVDVEAEKARTAAELTYRDKVEAAEKAKNDAVQKDLRERLLAAEKARLAAEEEMRNPSWWRTREFGIVIGVVTTAGAVALSIWAIDTATK